ncbi:hypothetical protein CEXT_288051 [Caerostris extrusa]|uniref:Uncharacterized protein n=1 Tax=Caerostris extrusa TaxID=172846 RepID=A0AAV4N419_CAEEX|nr:hypothetical protein CEXT_288051 [Caerostris extrusa]
MQLLIIIFSQILKYSFQFIGRETLLRFVCQTLIGSKGLSNDCACMAEFTKYCRECSCQSYKMGDSVEFRNYRFETNNSQLPETISKLNFSPKQDFPKPIWPKEKILAHASNKICVETRNEFMN